MIKKIFIVFISSLLLNGCDKKEHKLSASETARYQAEQIISYVKQEDAEGLKGLFSSYIQENHDLDAEISKLFEFIDGTIISYDAPWGSSASKSAEPNGTKYELLVGHVTNVKTDVGTNYLISFNSIYIDKKNEDYIGIDFISISNQDSYNLKNGYNEEIMAGEVLK